VFVNRTACFIGRRGTHWTRELSTESDDAKELLSALRGPWTNRFAQRSPNLSAFPIVLMNPRADPPQNAQPRLSRPEALASLVDETRHTGRSKTRIALQFGLGS
jgi:hypothetical protein